MKKFLPLLLLCLFTITALAQAQPAATDSVEALKRQIEQMRNPLNDWPNLRRYADANANLAPPAQDEDRVVFMGDSITDGWRLAELFPKKPYINRGISGQTTPQMLIRFRPDVLAHKPEVVVILAGTNDIAGNTGPMTVEMVQDNIASMADLAQANGISVVLSSVLPVHDYGMRKMTPGRPPALILKLNEWMKNFCAKKGHVYLDYFSAMADDKGFLKAELANDGLHPNAAGYKIMVPLAEAAIQAALKKKR